MMNLPLIITDSVNLLEHLFDMYMCGAVELLELLLPEPVAVLICNKDNFIPAT